MARMISVERLKRKLQELKDLAEKVQEDIDAKRDANSEKSDNWQDSDAAMDWEEYLDEAEEIVQNIQSATDY